jgi:hypothetical protein
MTVCVAALAAGGGCIVCVADKALSYGNDVTWDSDAKKIIPIGTLAGQACALTAGKDRYLTRLLRKITPFDGYCGPLEYIVDFLEEKYKECLTEMQDIEILTPKMLTRAQYISAISKSRVNSFFANLKNEADQFSQEFDCELIVCGFAQTISPYILSVVPPGVVVDCTNNGILAAGTGAEKAMSRLLFVEHKRTDGIAHVIYDCFDAKANAEMSAFVGYDWDTVLVSRTRIRPLLSSAKSLLDKVWAKRNRSPFKKKREPDDLPDPPTNWEMRLREIVAESLGTTFNDAGEWEEFKKVQSI